MLLRYEHVLLRRSVAHRCRRYDEVPYDIHGFCGSRAPVNRCERPRSGCPRGHEMPRPSSARRLSADSSHARPERENGQQTSTSSSPQACCLRPVPTPGPDAPSHSSSARNLSACRATHRTSPRPTRSRDSNRCSRSRRIADRYKTSPAVTRTTSPDATRTRYAPSSAIPAPSPSTRAPESMVTR